MSAATFTFARRNLAGAARLPWRPALVAITLNCAGVTSADAQTVDGYACTRDSDRRTIEILYSDPSGLPCEVRYSTGPGRQSKWGARSTPGFCESLANRIRMNLQNGGFQCVALAGGEQPAGTVEARREPGEAEIVQAANAALDKCLTKLRTMGAGCADQQFAFKAVGRAETPMAIGGADVPVFLVEARYGPGSRSHAQGLLYLVSQNDPQLRRLVDESYGNLRSARSADLNDDGRTEIMVFTSYSAGRGFGHTSFVVMGDARMLGYAVAQDAPVRIHEVYVLASRTSGYRDLMALAGDSVFECHYRFGYQCKQLQLLDTEGPP